MEDSSTDEQAARAAVCRAIAEQFALPEADFSPDVFLAADWTGEVQEGAVILVQTGSVLPAGGTEEAAESWMKVNDRLEEQGVDLYCEVKSPAVTAFYRFS
jgi:hypothetical protein